jgi:hypothetical protein
MSGIALASSKPEMSFLIQKLRFVSHFNQFLHSLQQT